MADLKIKENLTDEDQTKLEFLEETRMPKLMPADWWSDLLSAGLAEYIEDEPTEEEEIDQLPVHIKRRLGIK